MSRPAQGHYGALDAPAASVVMGNSLESDPLFPKGATHNTTASGASVAWAAGRTIGAAALGVLVVVSVSMYGADSVGWFRPAKLRVEDWCETQISNNTVHFPTPPSPALGLSEIEVNVYALYQVLTATLRDACPS